jgi:transcription elongation factor Elf1
MARAARMTLPLGSLTQRDPQDEATCTACESPRVTELTMNLTDGTPVDFISCRVCGHKTWTHLGQELTVEDVLTRTRK